MMSEIGDLQIGKIDFLVKNLGKVTVDIYDLNLLERIYSQSVIGSLEIEKSNADFAFTKSTNNIIISGLKRLFKKIQKNKI